MAECGTAIYVKDLNSAYDCRFIAQCGGRFLLISRSGDYRNGYLLHDWRAVLRELAALTVPAKLVEKVKTAESGAGQYVNVPLTWPLSAASLAALLGADEGEVRAELDDLAMPGSVYE